MSKDKASTNSVTTTTKTPSQVLTTTSPLSKEEESSPFWTTLRAFANNPETIEKFGRVVNATMDTPMLDGILPKMDKMQPIKEKIELSLIQTGLTQPFELAKVKKQLEPDKSYMQLMREGVSKQGPTFFLKGFIPNLVRNGSQQTFRQGILFYAKKFFEDNLPDEVKQKYPDLTKHAAVGVLMIVDPFFITPIESIKTFLMTAPPGTRPTFKDALRGFPPTALRQAGHFTALFTTNNQFQKMQKDGLLTETQAIIWSAIVSAFITTPLLTPIDRAKTLMQDPNSSYTASGAFKFIGKSCIEPFQKGGVKGGINGLKNGALCSLLARIGTNLISNIINLIIANKALAAEKEEKVERRSR